MEHEVSLMCSRKSVVDPLKFLIWVTSSQPIYYDELRYYSPIDGYLAKAASPFGSLQPNIYIHITVAMRLHVPSI